MYKTTETKKPTHIIHASWNTEMPGHRPLTFTVIECHWNEGAVITYDFICPICNENVN